MADQITSQMDPGHLLTCYHYRGFSIRPVSHLSRCLASTTGYYVLHCLISLFLTHTQLLECTVLLYSKRIRADNRVLVRKYIISICKGIKTNGMLAIPVNVYIICRSWGGLKTAVKFRGAMKSMLIVNWDGLRL